MKKLIKLSFIAGLLLLMVGGLGKYLETAQERHDLALVKKVGSQVFRLYGKELTSGGTGFEVKAASGRTVTVTNSHVCAINNGGRMWANVREGRYIPIKILEVSKKTDLCILEGLGNYDGLELGKHAEVQEKVYVVGHPRLEPTVSSSGTVFKYGVVKIMVAMGECPDTVEGPLSVEQEPTFGMNVCVLTIPSAGFTNATSLPGNSGSPMVNSDGKVVGVLFGGDQEVHWGVFVDFNDLQEFLKDY